MCSLPAGTAGCSIPGTSANRGRHHYPVRVHLQGAYADLGHGRSDFPVAESAADEILSLPIYPGRMLPTSACWTRRISIATELEGVTGITADMRRNRQCPYVCPGPDTGMLSSIWGVWRSSPASCACTPRATETDPGAAALIGPIVG